MASWLTTMCKATFLTVSTTHIWYEKIHLDEHWKTKRKSHYDYVVDALGCLHPCSGIGCSVAALFGLNCNENGNQNEVSTHSLSKFMHMSEFQTMTMENHKWITDLLLGALVEISNKYILGFGSYNCKKVLQKSVSNKEAVQRWTKNSIQLKNSRI